MFAAFISTLTFNIAKEKGINLLTPGMIIIIIVYVNNIRYPPSSGHKKQN